LNRAAAPNDQCEHGTKAARRAGGDSHRAPAGCRKAVAEASGIDESKLAGNGLSLHNEFWREKPVAVFQTRQTPLKEALFAMLTISRLVLRR
jgi:hypothetical protein